MIRHAIVTPAGSDEPRRGCCAILAGFGGWCRVAAASGIPGAGVTRTGVGHGSATQPRAEGWTVPDRAGTRRPRLAYLLTQDRGGPVDAAVALASRFAASGEVDVRFFGPAPHRGFDQVADLFTETRVGDKAAAGAIGATRARLMRWQPDVVHAEDRRSGLVVAGLGRLTGLRPGAPRPPKVVHTYHGVPDDVTQQWLDDPGAPPPSRYTRAVLAADALVARAVDRTVVVSPAMRPFLVDRLRVPAARVAHIDNGLVLPPFTARTGPVRHVLFVGLLVHRKGVDLLLEAWARATARGLPDDARLSIVGDGPERGALEGLARSLGLADRVRFLGFRPDVPDLMAGADAFVLPARMEQQPLVLIEAMASGLPVLSTDVGGTADMLGGLAGVVPPQDVAALADGLLALCGPDGAASGPALAELARRRFSVEACVAAHRDLYRSL